MFKIYVHYKSRATFEFGFPTTLERIKDSVCWTDRSEPIESGQVNVYAEGIPYVKDGECLYCRLPLSEKVVEEFNFLSHRTESMSADQLERFGAAVCIKKPNTLADMLNLSCSMEHYRFYPDLLSDHDLGRYILMKNFNNELRIELAGIWDFDEAGYRCRQKYGGCFTRKGYLVLTKEPAEPFYDGKQLPDPEYEITSPLVLTVVKNRKSHNIYLPAPDVNLNFWKEQLGVDNLNAFRDFYISHSIDGLKERLPCGSSFGELNHLAAKFKAELDNEQKWQLCLAAFEAEAPASVEEAIRIMERLDEYQLKESVEETREDAVLTSFGYLWNEIHPISFPKDMESFRLFSPLSATFFTHDSWEYTSDMPQEWNSFELMGYEEEIREALDREWPAEESDRGLAIYLHNRLLGRKVYSMFPTVEVWKEKLWGVLEVKTFGGLSPGEMAGLMDEWEGQCSDGFGEGFEQRPVSIDLGELYVSFWNPYHFQLQTEQELKESQEQEAGIQMGGQ